MQIEKIRKYATKFKFVMVIPLLVITGILYSCSFHTGGGDTQFTTLKSELENAVTADTREKNGTEPAVETQETFVPLPSIYVYVCGCVVNPGVYAMREDMRIYQAVNQAGGFTENADQNYLNMADFVLDGQKIYVPDRNENLTPQGTQAVQNTQESGININNATKEQLMTLPGIGAARAEDIITYRQANGKFQTAEDIMKVSGIKEAAFSKIKDFIVVK